MGRAQAFAARGRGQHDRRATAPGAYLQNITLDPRAQPRQDVKGKQLVKWGPSMNILDQAFDLRPNRI